MNKKYIWILGDQLFENHPAAKIFSKKEIVFLFIESKFFSSRFNYHPIKIEFLHESMRNYAGDLKRKGFEVLYFKDKDLKEVFQKKKINKLYFCKTANKETEGLFKVLKDLKIEVELLENPSFLTLDAIKKKHFAGHKKFSFLAFYIDQRKELDILLENYSNPIGGKWTYDVENRKKLPSNLIPPDLPETEKLWLPTTYKDARKWFDNFLENRFRFFGFYEDAISSKHNFNFHSVISPLLNIGLLEPKYVVQRTLEYSRENKITLNNTEGFIRQIIGWREYIKNIYDEASDRLLDSNHFNFDRKMPKSFYDGTTGMTPFDDMVKKVNKYAYAHHIERLMIAGNLMLLCEINPIEVYKWFMELFVDAYEWVMLPNVMGMSQFAAGDIMMTKPYISSSSYILKMSDYPKKNEWAEIWTALYWRFIDRYRDDIGRNPRMSMMLKIFARKTEKERDEIFKISKEFLNSLD